MRKMATVKCFAFLTFPVLAFLVFAFADAAEVEKNPVIGTFHVQYGDAELCADRTCTQITGKLTDGARFEIVSVNPFPVDGEEDSSWLLMEKPDGTFVRGQCCIEKTSSDSAEYYKLVTVGPTEFECNLKVISQETEKWESFTKKYPVSKFIPDALEQTVFLYYYPTLCHITLQESMELLLRAENAYSRLSTEFPNSASTKKAKLYMDSLRKFSPQ